MADNLPSFGNISAISYEGNNTIHEYQTLNGTNEMDSQETTFNDSQTISQCNNDFNSDHPDSQQRDDGTSMEIATDTEVLEEAGSSTMALDDTPNIEEESPNITEEDSEPDSNDNLMETVLQLEEDGTEHTEGEVIGGAGGGTDDEDEELGEKLYQLPISKIKRIMKTDPDTKLITKDALAAMAISTEHFLAMLAQQSFKLAVRSKKKRIALEHVKSTITSSASCDFLEGTIPEFDI